MSAPAATVGTGPVKALPSGRYGLPALLRSEWTKLRTVRSTAWVLAVTVVIGLGVSALAAAESRAHWASMSPAARASFDPTQVSLVGTFFGQLAIGVLGVLAVSGEYHSGTIRATFAAVPRRLLVLWAKVLVFGALVLVVCEALSFASFFLGQALLGAPATHATLASPGALRAVVGTGCFLCVIGLFALAVAALVRHTAGAISVYVGVLLVLPLVLEALPSSLQDAIRRYLPSHIGDAIVSAHSGLYTFSPWAGLLLLCGYVAVLLAVAGALLLRRDA